MSNMFYECENFNQPLGNWNTQNVKDMSCMFYGCKSFNFPLWNWNINNVSYCWGMFNNCESFKENLNTWNLPRNYEFKEMFEGCNIPKENLPQGITFKEEDNSDILLTDEVKGKLTELPKEVIEQYLSQVQATSVNQENEQVQENVVDEVSSEEQQCEQVDVPASLKSNQDLSREF